MDGVRSGCNFKGAAWAAKKHAKRKEAIEFQFVDELFLFRKNPFIVLLDMPHKLYVHVLDIWELHNTCLYIIYVLL